MRKILLAVFWMTGCATLGQRESVIRLPAGEVYTVQCLSDAQVGFHKGDIIIRIDNRGKPNPFESAMGMAATTVIGAAKAVTPTVPLSK